MGAVTRRGSLRVGVALAAGALVLGVGGCGVPSAGAAALVDGHRISIAELQDAAADFGPLTQTGAISPGILLGWMIAEPTVVDVASKHGVGVSAEDAKARFAEIAKAVQTKGGGVATSNPTVGSVQAMRFFVSMEKLTGSQSVPSTLSKTEQEAAMAELTARLGKLDLQVNPRFGTFDAKNLVVMPKANPWLVEAKAPAQPPIGQ